MNKSNREWAEEFLDFLEAEEHAPPVAVSERLAAHVRAELHPSLWRVFSKLALVHLLVGSVTLLFCPQFGINLLGGMGLMAVFMRFGEIACTLGCGAFFLGTSVLVGSLVLRPEEVRTIRANRVLQISLLSGLSIGAFICLGAPVVATFAAAWATGSILGGLATLEVGWLVRYRPRVLRR